MNKYMTLFIYDLTLTYPSIVFSSEFGDILDGFIKSTYKGHEDIFNKVYFNNEMTGCFALGNHLLNLDNNIPKKEYLKLMVNYLDFSKSLNVKDAIMMMKEYIISDNKKKQLLDSIEEKDIFQICKLVEMFSKYLSISEDINKIRIKN